MSLSNYTTYQQSKMKVQFLCPVNLALGSILQIYFPALNPTAPESLQKFSLPLKVNGSFTQVPLIKKT